MKRRMKKGYVWMVVAVAAVMIAGTGCGSGGGYEYPTAPTPEPVPPGWVWSELPEIPRPLPAAWRQITHRETFGGRPDERSFTMMYDTGEKVSYWVAYPLHPIHMAGGRTGSFAFDPQVPQNQQMQVTQGQGGFGSGFDRGHQIPSADRTANVNANQQTFFLTNITPQNADLNQNEWALLEAWVRARASESSSRGPRYDTLYVVTGCVIRPTPDGEVARRIEVRGVTGAVPVAYYKVLLRTRTGYPRVPNEIDAECIGVWMENSVPATGWRNYVKTVSEIEQLTGLTFFPSVPSSVKSTYNASSWKL